jgi:hypothetical protein
MRILGPIVLPQALLMASRQSHLRLGRAVSDGGRVAVRIRNELFQRVSDEQVI